MEGIKDTSTLTFRKILGNGLKYEIPKFQRDYSWETEHWDDLWQDLEDLYYDNENSHYMGYLVLQTSDNKAHKVIDGQQRLTTMSIFIITALKHLKELEEKDIDAANNKIRREQLQSSYIGYLDPVTLIADNKLRLNRNNDSFYKSYIVPLEHMPQRNTNSSEKLMRAAFEWFYKKMAKYKTGEELVGFIDKIVDKLFFTVITVGNELNAYKVFETLNSRGVQLSSSDLLKNYLFSTVDTDPNGAHNAEFSQLEFYWGNITDKLKNAKLQEFLRYYWNSKNKTIRKNDLFKTIRKNINSKADVFDLLRDLDKKADVFVALLNPNDEFWNGRKEICKALRELKIFGAKQQLSLLLSAYTKLDVDGFIQILKICSVIYFRYNVIGGLNPNEQESAFNKIAIQINDKGSFSKSDFEKIYPKDDVFENSFSNKELKDISRNRKIIKYILVSIENSRANGDYDFTSDQNTIEHILPQNPSVVWDLDDNEINRSVYRLGNMCLLEKGKNSDSGNDAYEVKKNIFKNSGFATTKSVPEKYEKWTEDSIVSRQKQMAKRALSIWKVQF